ncbi:hypothetical protein PAHAL_1G088500 [Panicum hallii]|uniref:Uncharacterized protein n=1 Tax=Panicum hallii TaxID=206008 RepID=A0A2T8KUJ8_9POAL|nr:hypothetical protein PAHAL_1G088500 [Panicum hallii]
MEVWGVLGRFGGGADELAGEMEKVQVVSGGRCYRCLFGPPGPVLARARHGPVNFVPGWSSTTLYRAVLAHGLHRRPKPGSMGMFPAGPARKARVGPAHNPPSHPPDHHCLNSKFHNHSNFTNIQVKEAK